MKTWHLMGMGIHTLGYTEVQLESYPRILSLSGRDEDLEHWALRLSEPKLKAGDLRRKLK